MGARGDRDLEAICRCPQCRGVSRHVLPKREAGKGPMPIPHLSDFRCHCDADGLVLIAIREVKDDEKLTRESA